MTKLEPSVFGASFAYNGNTCKYSSTSEHAKLKYSKKMQSEWLSAFRAGLNPCGADALVVESLSKCSSDKPIWLSCRSQIKCAEVADCSFPVPRLQSFQAVDGQRALLQHKVTLDQSIIDAIQETIKKEVDLALHHGDQGHPVQADGPVATTVNQTALFQGDGRKKN